MVRVITMIVIVLSFYHYHSNVSGGSLRLVYALLIAYKTLAVYTELCSAYLAKLDIQRHLFL